METEAASSSPPSPPSPAPLGLSTTRFPSEKNQRTGRNLAAAGVVVTAIVAGLGWWFLESPFLYWWVAMAAVWGALALGLGATRGRIDVSDSTFTVRTSMFTPVTTVKFDAKGEIELDETEVKGEASEWRVCLKNGEDREVLVRKVEGQLTLRNVAETLCKITALPMLDASSDPVVRLEAADLDLPFKDRIQKYPQYDIAADPATRTVGIDIDSPEEGATRFAWHYLARSGVRTVAAVTVVACILFAVAEEEGALYDLVGWWGLGVIAATGGIVMLCLGLFRTKVVLGARQISLVHLVGRLPVWKGSVVTAEVEDVRVIHRSVAVISDRGILRFRTRISGDADESNARWMANQVRSYLVSRAPGAA